MQTRRVFNLFCVVLRSAFCYCQGKCGNDVASEGEQVNERKCVVVHCWCHWNCLCAIAKLNSYLKCIFSIFIASWQKMIYCSQFCCDVHALTFPDTAKLFHYLSPPALSHKRSTCSKWLIVSNKSVFNSCWKHKHTYTHTSYHWSARSVALHWWTKIVWWQL